MHNKYIQYTHIYYVNNAFILDAINRLTTLVIIYFYIDSSNSRLLVFVTQKVLWTGNCVVAYFYSMRMYQSSVELFDRVVDTLFEVLVHCKCMFQLCLMFMVKVMWITIYIINAKESLYFIHLFNHFFAWLYWHTYLSKPSCFKVGKFIHRFFLY